MKNRIIVLITASLLTAATIAIAANPLAPLSTPELKKTISSNGKPTLVFFQNPYGGPCKSQKSILDKLTEQRKGSFNIASVNAMNQNDQKAFNDYGVRSLPSLVLVDSAGKISRVFSPGIQNIEAISSALDGLK
ncbi:MAG: thioredoxin family protein [Desulfuromonadales bacterium]